MSEAKAMRKDELLAAIEAGWEQFQAYLATLTYEQVTIPTDAAGWTAKDHIAHLAAWEDTLNALLDKTPRWERLGVDYDLWASNDWDKVNAVVQQRYKDISVGDLRQWFFGVHERLIAKLKALSDADLQRPYQQEYQTSSTQEMPISHWFTIDTYEHYAEHTPWIAAIAEQQGLPDKAQLLAAIKIGWNDLNGYLNTLSPAQRAEKTDAAGWTVKDHAIHLAIWEDGIYALLSRLLRIEYMGIDEATWENGDNDAINAVIQLRYKDLSWAEVQAKRQQIHQRLVEKIEALSDEDLLRPYRFYEPASSEDRPVVHWITGNTFAHYAEHRPWMQAIAES